jgi:hypothetical protein
VKNELASGYAGPVEPKTLKAAAPEPAVGFIDHPAGMVVRANNEPVVNRGANPLAAHARDDSQFLKVGQSVFDGALAVRIESQLDDLLVDALYDCGNVRPHEPLYGAAFGLTVQIPDQVRADPFKVSFPFAGFAGFQLNHRMEGIFEIQSYPLAVKFFQFYCNQVVKFFAGALDGKRAIAGVCLFKGFPISYSQTGKEKFFQIVNVTNDLRLGAGFEPAACTGIASKHIAAARNEPQDGSVSAFAQLCQHPRFERF